MCVPSVGWIIYWRYHAKDRRRNNQRDNDDGLGAASGGGGDGGRRAREARAVRTCAEGLAFGSVFTPVHSSVTCAEAEGDGREA